MRHGRARSLPTDGRFALLPLAQQQTTPRTPLKRAPPESGFTDMLRVGALARIALPLLGFSLHAGDDSRDALSQLNAMLPDARGRDAELIRCGGGGRARVGGAVSCCPGDGGRARMPYDRLCRRSAHTQLWAQPPNPPTRAATDKKLQGCRPAPNEAAAGASAAPRLWASRAAPPCRRHWRGRHLTVRGTAASAARRLGFGVTGIRPCCAFGSCKGA